MLKHFVRVLADHQVIGSTAVNAAGQPLTEREARVMAKCDAASAERQRQLQGRKTRFDFIAVSVEF